MSLNPQSETEYMVNKHPSKWLPPHLLSIKPYVPGKPIEEVQRELGLKRVIKLASNENAFGPCPSARKILRESAEKVHYYPDGGGYYLRKALAELHNVPMEHIALGAGSTELVQLLIYSLLTHEDHVVIADATFLMYQLACRVMNIPFTAVPLNAYRYDLDAMLEALTPQTKMLFIANPNNPTGTYVTRDEMKRFLEKVPEHVLVVYDEAYCHYAQVDDYPLGMEFFEKYPNLVILRTFSKAYGLAGLRIGYALARPEILAGIHILRSPFNTASIAQEAALASLQDNDYINHVVKITYKERLRVTRALRELGFHVLPSVTNFLCLILDHTTPETFFQTLLKEGIIIRPLKMFGVPNGVRITIGTPEQNTYLIETLKRLYPQGVGND